MIDMYDIVTKIHTWADGYGWRSHLGFDSYYQNVATNTTYAVGETILVFDARPQPLKVVANAANIQWRCTTRMLLGRKFEATGGTFSSLDETSQQKYDRRLSELTLELTLAVHQFACDNGYKVQFSAMEYEVNLFDANADFVACEITFEMP